MLIQHAAESSSISTHRRHLAILTQGSLEFRSILGLAKGTVDRRASTVNGSKRSGTHHKRIVLIVLNGRFIIGCSFTKTENLSCLKKANTSTRRKRWKIVIKDQRWRRNIIGPSFHTHGFHNIRRRAQFNQTTCHETRSGKVLGLVQNGHGRSQA